jgi:hypothetical protein
MVPLLLPTAVYDLIVTELLGTASGGDDYDSNRHHRLLQRWYGPSWRDSPAFLEYFLNDEGGLVVGTCAQGESRLVQTPASMYRNLVRAFDDEEEMETEVDGCRGPSVLTIDGLVGCFERNGYGRVSSDTVQDFFAEWDGVRGGLASTHGDACRGPAVSSASSSSASARVPPPNHGTKRICIAERRRVRSQVHVVFVERNGLD